MAEEVRELNTVPSELLNASASATVRDVRSLFPAGKVSPLSWGLDAADWQVIQPICDAASRGSNGKVKGPATPRRRSKVKQPSEQLVEQPSEQLSEQPVDTAGSPSPLIAALNVWLSKVEGESEPHATFGLELLAWTYRLSDLADVGAEGVRARLQAQFDRLASDLGASGEQSSAAGSPDDAGDITGVDARDHAWRRVELLLSLAASHPTHEARLEWARRAADQLNQAWAAWIDPEGMPCANLLPRLPAIFASWTRSRHLWHAAELPGWTDNHTARFEGIAASVWRLRRWDGTCGGDSMVGPTCAEEAGKSPVSAGPSLDAALSVAVADKRRGEWTDIAKATPTEYSEFAQVASCRSQMAPNGLHVLAMFPGDTACLEISLAKQMFLAGCWRPRVESDGCEHAVCGSWHEVSWFSDEDADYLELGMELEHGWYIRRHMLLARDARLFFAGDAVFGASPGRIKYEAEIPLGSGVQFVPEAETNDGKLVGPHGHARVMPLALPEWRLPGASAADGELSSDGRALRWTWQRTGQRLFAPVAISCDPRTIDAPLTWRQLTVAETRQQVPPDVAVAFRVQVARKQWFFYRSLNGFGNRTALGQNVSGQFVAGEFLKNGTLHGFVETEMEVEA